jgi:hypothetical protein
MNLVNVALSDIEPHPQNANTHSDHQINELQGSLDEFEQIKNIVIWKNYIIAGNGLYAAAKQMGMETIQAVNVSEWDEQKALRFMIADNRLAELAEIDQAAMTALFEYIGDPLSIPGVDIKWLDNFQLPEFEPTPEEDQPRLDETRKIACPNCGFEWET